MMAWLRRRERPPTEVVAQLPDGERVVSWADTADGQVVLATPSGLWWPEPSGPRLIPWPHIDKAIWNEQGLSVVEADVVDNLLLVDRAPVSVRLALPRDLPPTVRKRVDGNVVRTQVLAVGSGSVRFVARRVPGQDGVSWWARLENGARDTAEVREAIRARLAVLRAEAAAELSR